MDKPDISQDDLLDVEEMTKHLVKAISEILDENQTELAMSALMSASINFVLCQCKSINEVIFYRQIFMDLFDHAIQMIIIKKKK